MEVTRDRAWETLTRHTKSESLRRHALAVEASVRFYARLHGEDEEQWGCVAGAWETGERAADAVIRRLSGRLDRPAASGAPTGPGVTNCKRCEHRSQRR